MSEQVTSSTSGTAAIGGWIARQGIAGVFGVILLVACARQLARGAGIEAATSFLIAAALLLGIGRDWAVRQAEAQGVVLPTRVELFSVFGAAALGGGVVLAILRKLGYF